MMKNTHHVNLGGASQMVEGVLMTTNAIAAVHGVGFRTSPRTKYHDEVFSDRIGNRMTSACGKTFNFGEIELSDHSFAQLDESTQCKNCLKGAKE